MRVVILSETIARKMGYAGSMLPKYLARLGADVHLVTAALPPYYNIKDFSQTYGDFVEDSQEIPGTVETYDGYTIHVMKHASVLGYTKIKGLLRKLRSIKPDIVQTLVAIGHLPLDAAMAKPILGYKLFTGSHTTASVFPMAGKEVSLMQPEMLRNIITRALPGRIISLASERCYGATSDCADVAVRFFGVQGTKIAVCPLGVDTEIFKPISGSNDINTREHIRGRFGFDESEIVCIYTGRFSNEKNPMLLAQAIEILQAQGQPYRGLFIGNGVQFDGLRRIGGCVTHPFIPVQDLGDHFRASDIGVWPTQESMSMLDAAACGLPIIVNDTLLALERVRGNGLMYRKGDVADLVRVLLSLKDVGKRRGLGSLGAEKMRTIYSWDAIARRRLVDYEASLLIC